MWVVTEVQGFWYLANLSTEGLWFVEIEGRPSWYTWIPGVVALYDFCRVNLTLQTLSSCALCMYSRSDFPSNLRLWKVSLDMSSCKARKRCMLVPSVCEARHSWSKIVSTHARHTIATTNHSRRGFFLREWLLYGWVLRCFVVILFRGFAMPRCGTCASLSLLCWPWPPRMYRFRVVHWLRVGSKTYSVILVLNASSFS